MSKQKLSAARELIREKHYDEARAILKTVDHPTAKQWLAKLDQIAPEKKQSAWRSILFPRRGRSRLYWIGFTLFACAILYACSIFSQAIGIIPTTEEMNVTRTLEASTQVAANATEGVVQQMTADAQATIIALTPPTATATITDTPIPTATATITNTPLPTNTLAPTATLTPKPFIASEYQRMLADGLFIAAGGRNIESIQVADGRPNGGERGVIIAYLTTETDEVGYVDEWFDIFSAVAATIRADNLDVDSVTLIAGTPTGQTAGAITVSVGDLLAYHQGELSRSEFLSRMQAVSF